jgi:hypothetical protein
MTSALEIWLPKSILLLRGYDRHKFLSDLIAGVTGGLVALPLAMAFAITPVPCGQARRRVDSEQMRNAYIVSGSY